MLQRLGKTGRDVRPEIAITWRVFWMLQPYRMNTTIAGHLVDWLLNPDTCMSFQIKLANIYGNFQTKPNKKELEENELASDQRKYNWVGFQIRPNIWGCFDIKQKRMGFLCNWTIEHKYNWFSPKIKTLALAMNSIRLVHLCRNYSLVLPLVFVLLLLTFIQIMGKKGNK